MAETRPALSFRATRHEGWITVKALGNPLNSISIKAQYFELQSVIYKISGLFNYVTLVIQKGKCQI